MVNFMARQSSVACRLTADVWGEYRSKIEKLKPHVRAREAERFDFGGRVAANSGRDGVDRWTLLRGVLTRMYLAHANAIATG